MKDYGMIRGTTEPQPIVISQDKVFVASDIQPFTEEMEDRTVSGYKYHYIEYDKDEFLLQQTTSLTALQEELAAAKILLGVE